MILDIVKWDPIQEIQEIANNNDVGAGLSIFGKSVLRAQSKNITTFDRELYDLSQNMIETMLASNGVGLAAPQIGKNINLFVMRMAPWESIQTRVIVNPTLTLGNETYFDNEGCLSLPRYKGRVERHKELAYAAMDLEGKPTVGTFSEMEARIFQHENDHLRGRLFIDTATEIFYGDRQVYPAKC